MLERRKVYIEFTGPSSVLLVTPYRSKELQLKPEDKFKVLDLISLSAPKEGDDLFFWANIKSEKDEDSSKSIPEYVIVAYVFSGIGPDGKRKHTQVDVVRIHPTENKKKIEVSYKAN